MTDIRSHDHLQLYNRGDQALKVGLVELEQMRPEKRYYYLKELWYIAQPDRPVYHRGPNKRRNKNIEWLFKRRYIQLNEGQENHHKYYIITPLGRELLACFTEEQLEKWKKSTKTYQHFHGSWKDE